MREWGQTMNYHILPNEPVVFHYWIVPISCGFSVVIVEQPTESLPFNQGAIARVIVGRLDKRTAETLVRALNMIV